jgi:hypothetical protein
MSEQRILYVQPAEGIPGLWDAVYRPGENAYWDLSVGQVRDLATRLGATIVKSAHETAHDTPKVAE